MLSRRARIPGEPATKAARWTSRLGVATVAVALAALTAGCGSGGGAGSSGVPAPSSSVGTQIDGAIPADISHLPVTDQDGRQTDLAAFRGKVLMISDSMTLCQETCPLDTANLVQTAHAVDQAHEGADVEFLTITVDPERDTPAQLAAYRRQYAPTPANWEALTGTSADVAKLWKYFGVWYQKVPEGSPPAKNWRTGQPLTYDIDHADEIFFLDSRDNERFVINGAAHVAAGTRLPATMQGFLDSDGLRNLQQPQDGSWTVSDALQTLGWLLQRTIGPPSGS
ncbi:SCO family protein [Streptomyces sp. RB6PN25]|uniref:SCO family protein n=1 Tax=Streptomyces humicola TaxID=2953240 RepID=A0ABT1PSM0_9ACTN|nr:SCO family protein [Streptomyces humicola]MCQ4080108.1 SCO family protein [Streptomyces humicola]